MARPVTLFTAQWADMPLEAVAGLAASWGYDGLEVACMGDHLDAGRAARDLNYARQQLTLLSRHGLKVWAIGNPLAGQLVSDPDNDERSDAWAPMNSLAQTLEVIAEAGRDNLGLVVDFWHLWAGEATTPDDVARLDKNLIYGIHICDGKRRAPGALWNEGQQRGYLPGEGDIPLRDWVAAVKATGYDGVWSAETYSPRHWEDDLYDLAATCRDRVLATIG